jgi:hypothetical protein
MSSQTTYKVDLVYNMKGNATGGLKNMATQAKSTTAALGGMKGMIGLALGGAMFAAGKKYLWDFNNEVSRMKIGLATVTSMNFGRPFSEGAAAAEKMFNNFQKMAIESPATTKDFVNMANMIGAGVMQAGKGLKELETITKGAITASAALGAPAEMMALDITQMLAGTVAIRDRYARQLLSAVGEKDYLAFNKKSAGDRADIVQKALSSKQLTDAATAFGNSTEGVMSTLKDNLEITLGQVGLPLMKALTDEVKGWNQWISANPEKIKEMIGGLGSGLKQAFSVIKDIVVSVMPLVKDVFGVIQGVLSFASEHRETIVGLIKALMVYKGAQMAGGMAMGVGRGIGGFFGKFGEIAAGFGGMGGGIRGVTSGLGNMVGVLGGPAGVVSAVAQLGIAAWGAHKFLTNKTDYEKKQMARAQVQITTADEFKAKFDEYKNLREKQTRYGKFGPIGEQDWATAIGISDSQMAGTKQALDAYAEKLIDQMAAAGMVDETVENGKRKVTFLAGTGGLTGQEDIDVFNKQMDANKKMWNSALELAQMYEDIGQGYSRSLNDLTSTDRILGQLTQDISGPGTESPIDLYNTDLKPPPAKVDVTINKIEVASDDPDRFVHGMVSSFEEIVRNPTQAADAVRGGF